MKKNVLTLVVIVALWLGGCSWFPKITVIDDPLEREEHLQLGQAYESNGELDLAEREYRLAQPLPSAHLALGNLFFQGGNFKEAEKSYRRCLSLEFNPEAANNLAWLLFTLDRNLGEAVNLSHKAVIEGERLGLTDQDLDNYRDTLESIERKLDSQPQP